MAYVLVARLTLKQGCRERYLALLGETVVELAVSPCFVDFSIHASPEDADQVLLYETWTSREEYLDLRSGEAFQAYLAQREQFVEAVSREEWTLIGRFAGGERGSTLTAS